MNQPIQVNRREFVSKAALAAAGFVALNARADDTPKSDPFVGIQIHPFSFYDEGIERCLDLIQETAGVNALLVYTHLYHSASNMPVEILAPDHGVPVRTPSSRKYRTIWVRHNESAFKNTVLRHAAKDDGSEYAGKDLFADLAEPCRKRGIKILGRILEPQGKSYASKISNWERVLTKTLHGETGDAACWNNPDYKEWWGATVRDMFSQGILDGFMMGAERVGPLSRLLAAGRTPDCFCEFCLARAKSKSIDVPRVKEGFSEIQKLVQSLMKENAKPPEGAFTAVLGILMRYPELLAWEYQWAQSLEDSIATVGKTIKSVKPTAIYGRHVDHQQTSWDFLYRAAVKISDMAANVDFIKPATYHDIAAPRVHDLFVDRVHKTLLPNSDNPDILKLFYSLTGLNPATEPSYDDLMKRGFSPDYVYRETKRFVDGAAGKAAIYPGLAMDIPHYGGGGDTPKILFASDPAIVEQAALKAFEAGAKGIAISREYQEMRLPGLKAVGRAVAEIRKRK